MKRKEILLLSIGIFFTVLAILASDIYHVYTEAQLEKGSVAPHLDEYKIDSDLLNKLEQKTN